MRYSVKNTVKEYVQKIYAIGDVVLPIHRNDEEWWVDIDEDDDELREHLDSFLNTDKVKYCDNDIYDADYWFVCNDCGCITNLEDKNNDVTDEDICQECFEDHWNYCEYCGDYFNAEYDDYVYVDDRIFCSCDCACYAGYRQCDDCNKWVSENETVRTYDGKYVCERCRDYYVWCVDIDEYVDEDDAIWDENSEEYYYHQENMPNYNHVRAYHNNPNCIKHRYDDELNNQCFIGTEIETESGDYKERSEITWDYGKEEEYIYQMHDGSLNSSGIEMITQPMTLKFWDNFDFEGWFSALRDAGARSNDTASCGLHVHLSREWFGETSTLQQRIYGMTMDIMNLFRTELQLLARRKKSHWCEFPSESEHTALKEFVDNTETAGSWEEYIEALHLLHNKNYGRYVCLNKEKRPTYEFRIFRGTLNPTTYRASVMLCIRLVEYAKYKYEHKAYLLKDFSWQDFKTFKPMPEVLERYIAIRKEKQGGEIL